MTKSITLRLKNPLFYLVSCLFLFIANLKAQTLTLTGPTTNIVPCTDVTYSITGVPTSTSTKSIENLSVSWGALAGGTYTSSGITSLTATIRWDQTPNSSTKSTGNIRVTWNEITKDGNGKVTNSTFMDKTISPKSIQVLYIAPITGIRVAGILVTNGTTVDCGVQSFELEVSPPTTDPVSPITYTWTLPASWTLLAQGGTGGGQTNRVTVTTNTAGGGTISVKATRSDASSTGCPSQYSISVGRPIPQLPVFQTPAQSLCSSTTQRFTATSTNATSYEWQVSSGLGINGTTSQTLTTTVNYIDVKPTQTGNFAGTIQVRGIRSQCNVSSAWTSTNVWVGAPTIGMTVYDISMGTYEFCTNTLFNLFSVDPPPANSNPTYQWNLTPKPFGTQIVGTGSTVRLTVTQPGTYILSCLVSNSCGIGGEASTEITVTKCSGGLGTLSVYPNPANKDLTVELLSTTDNEKISNTSFTTSQRSSSLSTIQVQLLNKWNQIVWQGNLVNGKATLSTSSIPNGLYFLKVDDDQMTTKRILIQH
ncbi:T9SS type A sorting domain-containing protein [Cytophagaceae bacterium YF14B1]|uniref:T9SS type A sorting domain-containing protein n=1 Tax=Xanthocytophaga flava TaxID=3048013 RepID=A0AAE3QPC5_9BACT|nr:T9SS type A sorting domain-containing protein [Xanthocytophaga flavus]MDJ1480248.1 T9SS type A sorting domain-containing protein [Xanthocytophaga flavus]